MLNFIARTVVSVMLVAGCFWTPIARGQGHPAYQASIPFAFYVGDRVFPAGTYRITQPDRFLLLFHNAGGAAIAFQLVSPKQLPRSATTGQLTFSQYGSSYFLQEFSAPDESSGPRMASTISRGHLEQRAAKEVADARSQEVALIAISQR